MEASERLKNALLIVSNVVQVVGVVWMAFSDWAEGLEAQLTGFGISQSVAQLVRWMLLVALSASVSFVLWRMLRTRSKLVEPDRFELRVRSREQLRGRENDLRDLTSLILDNQVVFLVGESGSGKSALIESGVCIELLASSELVPVLVKRYGTSWNTGPSAELRLALLQQLRSFSPSSLSHDAHEIGLSPTSEDLNGVVQRFIGITRRQPILIFDQFDDYLAAQRTEFTNANGAWRRADEVEELSPFWHSVAALLRARAVKCIFVSRSDAAAGLECVRFSGNVSCAVRDLLRLPVEYIPPLLESVAPANAQPAIVKYPERGWEQLKEVVAREFEGKGAVLPQHLRTLMLGLRTIKYLTVAEYRRAGGAAGVEAAYIARAISECGERARIEVLPIRSMLLAMVRSSTVDVGSKTVPVSDAKLALILPNATSRSLVLQELVRFEVVRKLWNAELATEEWQLDHDYLARAVRQEERNSNLERTMLRDAETNWRAFSGDWRSQWTALLSTRIQLLLLWARLKPRSSFTYGYHQRFAALSTVKFFPIALFAGTVAMCAWFLELNSRVENLETTQDVQAIWRSSSNTKDFILASLQRRPANIERYSVAWPSALVDWNSTRRDKAIQIITQSPAGSYNYATQLQALTPQLDRVAANRIASSILGDAESSYYIVKDKVELLSELSGRVDPAILERIGAFALSQLVRATGAVMNDPIAMGFDRGRADCRYLRPIFKHLDIGAIRQAADILEPHIKAVPKQPVLGGCLTVYADQVSRLKQSGADVTSRVDGIRDLTDLLVRVSSVDAELEEYLLIALNALAVVDPEIAGKRAQPRYESLREHYLKECYQQASTCANQVQARTFPDFLYSVQELSHLLSPEDLRNDILEVLDLYTDPKRTVGSQTSDASAVFELVLEASEAMTTDVATQLLRTFALNAKDRTYVGIKAPSSLWTSMAKPGGAISLITILTLAQRADPKVARELMAEFDKLLIEDVVAANVAAPAVVMSLLTAAEEREVAEKVVTELHTAEGISTAVMLDALSATVGGLSETSLKEVAVYLIRRTLTDSSQAPILDSWVSAMAYVCEEMYKRSVQRAAAVECLLLASSAPVKRDRGTFSAMPLHSFARTHALMGGSGKSTFEDASKWASSVGVAIRDVTPDSLMRAFGIDP